MAGNTYIIPYVPSVTHTVMVLLCEIHFPTVGRARTQSGLLGDRGAAAYVGSVRFRALSTGFELQGLNKPQSLAKHPTAESDGPVHQTSRIPRRSRHVSPLLCARLQAHIAHSKPKKTQQSSVRLPGDCGTGTRARPATVCLYYTLIGGADRRPVHDSW